MPRWTGEGRFSIRGGERLSDLQRADLLSRARKVVGDLNNQIKLGGVSFGRRLFRLSAGAVMVATIMAPFPGSPPMVMADILVSGEEREEAEGEEITIYALLSENANNSNTSGISGFHSLARFTWSSGGGLVFREEFNLGGLSHSLAFGNAFHVRADVGRVAFVGRTDQFYPRINGFFDCFATAVRYVTNFSEHTFALGFPNAVQIGLSVPPPGAHLYWNGEADPCAGRFQVSGSRLQFSDANYQWGSAFINGMSWGYDAVEEDYIVASPRFDVPYLPEVFVNQPEASGVVFTNLTTGGNTHYRMDDVGWVAGIGQGAQDETHMYVAVGTNSGTLHILKYEFATSSIQRLDVGVMTRSINGNETCLALSETEIFFASEMGFVDFSTHRTVLWKVNKDLTGLTQVAQFDHIEDSPSDEFAPSSMFASPNGATVIIGNGYDGVARKVVAYTLTRNDVGNYDVSETIPSPIVAPHPATNGIGSRGWTAFQTVV